MAQGRPAPFKRAMDVWVVTHTGTQPAHEGFAARLFEDASSCPGATPSLSVSWAPTGGWTEWQGSLCLVLGSPGHAALTRGGRLLPGEGGLRFSCCSITTAFCHPNFSGNVFVPINDHFGKPDC